MKLKRLINKVAPFAETIASALGGPLAGNAVAFVADALGVEPTEKAIEQKLKNDPDALLRMREIDIAYDLKMKEQDIDVFALEVQDRASARDMAKVNMWPQIILAAAYNAGYFYMMFMLLSAEWALPDGAQGNLVAGLIGVLTAALKDINQFWFGSSFGSKHKVSPGA